MRHAWIGVASALRAPFVLRGKGLQRLLDSPAQAGPPGRSAPEEALRWSRGAVAGLARVPFSPWRDTCLYRSVAECLVLRRFGIAARVRLGVRSEDDGGIAAHAWVDAPAGTHESSYSALEPRSGG